MDYKHQSDSNTKLISQLESGDNKAFEAIFKQYYKGLCAYAYTFLKNHDASEEIVQEFFSELWAQHTVLKIKISLKLYLFRGIHNKCINQLKAHAVAQRRLMKYAQHTQYELNLLDIDTESDVYEYLFSESFERDVHEAINDLAPQQKHIFTLSRFHQKSYTDIATELDISINSVKTQMSRALQKLRNRLMDRLGKHPLIFLLLGLQMSDELNLVMSDEHMSDELNLAMSYELFYSHS